MAEDCLPPAVTNCINAFIESGQINKKPTTFSIANNHRTVKIEMTWKINQEVQRELDRQWREHQQQEQREQERKMREQERCKSQHETETRRVGDYTKLKQIARSHGRNGWQPKSKHQASSARFQSFSPIKEEPADQNSMPETASSSSAATLQAEEVRAEFHSSNGGAEGRNCEAGSWQEVKKKKPRNRRFRRKNKAAGTQTQAPGDRDGTGEELAELLNRNCHFNVPDILSPLKEVD